MIISILLFLTIMSIVDIIFINKKIYSPIFIFNIIWLVTLGLYELKLSTLQQDLSSRTLLIFFICIFSYNMTCILTKYIKFDFFKNKIKFSSKFMGDFKSIVQPKTVEDKIRIAKWIALILFSIQVIYSKGVPLIWKVTGDTRTYFDFGIPSLTGAWYGLIICLGAYSCLQKGKDKYIYILIGILILSRQVIMSIIIEAIFFAILDKTQQLTLKKGLIIILIGIIMFVGFNFLGNFRSGSNTMNNLFHPKEQYENLPDSIKWIYSYMTFSISNFNNLVGMTNGGVNYGVSMLSEILPTVIQNVVKLEANYNPYYRVLINFNVSTYLPSPYLDFGLCGIAFINIAIAILGVILYKKYNKVPNIQNRLLYSIFLHNIIFLFFTNMFLYLPIISQFVYIFIIFKEKEGLEDGKGENISCNSNI